VNAQGWNSKRINFTFIFELDPRIEKSALNLLEVGTFFLVCLLSSMYLYLAGVREGTLLWGIPAWVYPPVFWLFIIVALANPFPVFYRELRFWLLSACARGQGP
jgi:hypothetical protein